MRELNGTKAFPKYAEVFAQTEYEDLGWSDYFEAFKKLRDSGELEDELPGIADKKRRLLQERWGANYDDAALRYLENLYNGLMIGEVGVDNSMTHNTPLGLRTRYISRYP